MEYKGYTARVEFDADAGVLFGEVEGLRDTVTFEATDVRGLEEAFKASINDYLEQCAEEGGEAEKPYSGKFLLRVDPKLHREVAMSAARAGKSLNAFAAELFRNWIDRDRLAREPKQSVVREGPRTISNASSDSEAKVPIFPSASPAHAVADSTQSAAVWDWRRATRNTPGSITPNTPSSSKTPQPKASKNKAA